MPGRTLAVGDVHGCVRALDAILDAVQPCALDRVVVLGDFVDRGPDSKGVIDRLIELGARCRLECILGNHEQMLIEARSAALAGYDNFRIRAWLGFGGRQTLESYAVATPAELPDDAVALIDSCRDWLESETHLFVHASYDASLPIGKQPIAMLRWESLRDALPGPHYSGKTCIVGHTAQKDGEVLDVGYLKCIDTYCHGGKWLTALDVETGEIWQSDPRGRLRR
jgi:serine/threonine protein phosphatase 1